MRQYLILAAAIVLVSPLHAQEITPAPAKIPVFGEVGLGYGQTLFGSGTKAKLGRALGGSFKPGTGFNLLAGFYAAPQSWKGLGLGARVKGTFGSGVTGDAGDTYIFNYYAVSASTKYYASGTFNKGFYGRGSFGFGQFTTKRQNEESKLYLHQYAIGTTVALGVGYSLPIGKKALSLEAEWENSSRNGTVNGEGSVSFTSGQIGLNAVLSF